MATTLLQFFFSIFQKKKNRVEGFLPANCLCQTNSSKPPLKPTGRTRGNTARRKKKKKKHTKITKKTTTTTTTKNKQKQKKEQNTYRTGCEVIIPCLPFSLSLSLPSAVTYNWKRYFLVRASFLYGVLPRGLYSCSRFFIKSCWFRTNDIHEASANIEHRPDPRFPKRVLSGDCRTKKHLGAIRSYKEAKEKKY